MLDKYSRYYIERARNARRLTITIDDDLSLEFGIKDIKKLSHDIAIAIQDYYVKNL